MITRLNRLQRRSDFARLSKFGRVFYFPLGSLRVCKNNESITRFAFVVSSKISKKATVRNKIRRRMREAVRPCLPMVGAGYDVAFYPKLSVFSADFIQLKGMIADVLRKAGIWQ